MLNINEWCRISVLDTSIVSVEVRVDTRLNEEMKIDAEVPDREYRDANVAIGVICFHQKHE